MSGRNLGRVFIDPAFFVFLKPHFCYPNRDDYPNREAPMRKRIIRSVPLKTVNVSRGRITVDSRQEEPVAVEPDISPTMSDVMQAMGRIARNTPVPMADQLAVLQVRCPSWPDFLRAVCRWMGMPNVELDTVINDLSWNVETETADYQILGQNSSQSVVVSERVTVSTELYLGNRINIYGTRTQLSGSAIVPDLEEFLATVGQIGPYPGMIVPDGGGSRAGVWLNDFRVSSR